MIGRIESYLRRLRRHVSRSEWLARLLRLPLSTGTEVSPGLVLIQIDGLSQPEFEKALQRGELPFINRLIRREHYRVHRFYAGVPATTAAVQGELFYGIKGGVPGFNFKERDTGRLVRMYEPAAAARVESRLAAEGGEPLLKGGSCYAVNYTGGASEAHFCPTSHGWGPALREASPLAVIFLILSHTYSFLRTFVLLLIEIVLAIVDFMRGLIDGQDILKELIFVPTRVAITILLRELTTIGVKIDVARGLPAVHVNFLGYDEQAHRRGPSSNFAHWTLKGIDDAVARIWRAAHRSSRRHYDVWIYSDHGQEQTRSYENLHGREFSEAVAEVFSRHEGSPIQFRSSGARGAELQRVSYVGGKRFQKLFRVNNYRPEDIEGPHLSIAPLGPVARIYDDREPGADERNALARALVKEAKVPLVLVKDKPGYARAWTDDGEFVLPGDSVKVLGVDHPFLEEATQDLIAMCHHPDAGEFIASGWCAGHEAVSFAVENGAHGGFGPVETNGFALVSGDIKLQHNARDYSRPIDLRNAALQFLGRSERKPATTTKRLAADQETLRVMTYNVHSCIGMDGKLSPERIARVIARYAPDIVALQELDVGKSRTGSKDQAHLIASYLEMDYHFHPAMHVEEERYGDAILTHLPMRLVKAGLLPGLPAKPRLEPRGALWVAIDVHGSELQVMNTHLGLLPRERKQQVEALLGRDWLAHPDCQGSVVLCGDFNAMPSSPVCKSLRKRLDDAQVELDSHRPRSTFFGRFPTARIDHVFVDSTIEVTDIEVPATELVRVASDHLPLIIEIRLKTTA
jgi:endonuclease/exonuclease/phosphatase family metal-dependent hydrolase